MPYLRYDNIRIASLVTAVPAHRQCIQIPEEAAHARQIKTYVKQIGVQSRHISLTEQTCVDTGYAAARKALEMCSLTATDLDGVIFASQTPDFNPATSNAHLMHYRLGMREDVIAFDIPLACSAFPYSLSVCAALIQQSEIHRILLIIGDTWWSNYPNPASVLADTRCFVGEGTSAIILERTDASAPKTTIALFSDGSGYKHLFSPFVGHRNTWRHCYPRARTGAGQEVIPGPNMDGLEITTFATTRVVDAIKVYAEKTGMRPEEYDGVILHQANKQIVRTMAKRLGLTDEQVPLSLDRYANIAGASVPLTISDAFHADTREELHLLTSAFGTGLSWGIASIHIRPAVIHPILLVEDDRFEEGYLHPIE